METKSLMSICSELLELDPEAEGSAELIRSRLNMLDNKVDNYVNIYHFTNSQISMLKDEIEHVKNQIKQFERLQEFLKYSAKTALDRLGETRIKSDKGHKISILDSESVVIDDLTKIPDNFLRKKITIEADKTAIKTAFKSGDEIPGCHIEVNQNIQFK